MSVEKSLSFLARFYIYGLNGIFMEIIYTSLWDLGTTQKFKLMGISSTWAFFIYGFATCFIEYIGPKLISLKIILPIRGLFYLLWTYIWEFSAGYILNLFDACPWKYEFPWNFMGLVTLEYAPLWYLANIAAEKVTISLVNKLCWKNEFDVKQKQTTEKIEKNSKKSK